MLLANDEACRMNRMKNALATARVEDWGAYVSCVWIVASARRRAFMGSSRRRDVFAEHAETDALTQRCQ